MPTWAYVVAAVVGSAVGAVLDVLLYEDGGSQFMKIGLAAGPAALFALSRSRARRDDQEDKP